MKPWRHRTHLALQIIGGILILADLVHLGMILLVIAFGDEWIQMWKDAVQKRERKKVVDQP